jgi:hypothetical protein
MHDNPSPMLEAHRLSFELADITELPELYQAIVDKGRRRLGFDRMSLWLFDPGSGTVRGTWAVDSRGRLVDESAFSAPIGSQESLVQECLEAKDFVAVRENQELTDGGVVVGMGWTAMVAL